MNYFDLISSLTILVALYLIPKHKYGWAVYAFGCFLWILLSLTKGLYFGMIMNTVAMVIGLKNWINR